EATGAPTAAAAPVATEVPTAEAPAVEFAAAAATPAPARAETDAVQPASSWASPLRLGLLGGALALGGLAAFCVQRQLARRRQLALRSEHVTLEAKRREEVARKAENRVRLESEVREILQKPE